MTDMPEYVYCIGCGEYFGDDMASKPQHVCQFPEDDDFCGHCGAELTEFGTCLNDHADEVPEGVRRRPGVYVGCGSADCARCYEALKALRDNVENDLSGFWTESTSNVMQQADDALAKAAEGKG